MCHLIYPASRAWHETSDTAILLMSSQGQEVAQRNFRIPCGGSVLWRLNETFNEAERIQAPLAYPEHDELSNEGTLISEDTTTDYIT